LCKSLIYLATIFVHFQKRVASDAFDNGQMLQRWEPLLRSAYEDTFLQTCNDIRVAGVVSFYSKQSFCLNRNCIAIECYDRIEPLINRRLEGGTSPRRYRSMPPTRGYQTLSSAAPMTVWICTTICSVIVVYVTETVLTRNENCLTVKWQFSLSLIPFLVPLLFVHILFLPSPCSNTFSMLRLRQPLFVGERGKLSTIHDFWVEDRTFIDSCFDVVSPIAKSGLCTN
jgi:hypothetical protein